MPNATVITRCDAKPTVPRVEARENVNKVIDYMGDDTIVFSTDWPHGDSKYPHAVASFMRRPISDEGKRKILWDNCARYYRITQ